MWRIPTQKISHACQPSYFTEQEKKRQKKNRKKEVLSYQRTRVRRLILMMMMTRLLLLVEEALQGVDNRAGLYLQTAENKFKSENCPVNHAKYKEFFSILRMTFIMKNKNKI
jgi:hypothetical protein